MSAWSPHERARPRNSFAHPGARPFQSSDLPHPHPTRYGIQEKLHDALEHVVNDEILEIINELAGMFLGLAHARPAS